MCPIPTFKNWTNLKGTLVSKLHKTLKLKEKSIETYAAKCAMSFYLHILCAIVLCCNLYSLKHTTCLSSNRIAERVGSCHNPILNFCAVIQSFPTGMHPLNFFPLYFFMFLLSDNFCIWVQWYGRCLLFYAFDVFINIMCLYLWS